MQGIRFGYYTHYRINREKLQQVIEELSMLMQLHKPRCAGAPRGCSVAQEVECKNNGNKGGNESTC